jgi:hypothetical protein
VAGAPDYAEPLCGWRAWLLVERGHELFLRSVVYPTLWQPRQPLEAECLDRQHLDVHVAPAASCRCGIYVASQPARAANFLDSYRSGWLRGDRLVRSVLGRAFLWGKVVECEAGWRAGRAYPAHFYLLSGGGRRRRLVLGRARRTSSSAEIEIQAAQALAAYGVPVELLDAHSRQEALAALAWQEREAS